MTRTRTLPALAAAALFCLGSSPLAAQVTERMVGNWAIQVSVDPIDDAKTILLFRDSADGLAVLRIRCSEAFPGGSNVAVAWTVLAGGNPIEDVTVRFDSESAQEDAWWVRLMLMNSTGAERQMREMTMFTPHSAEALRALLGAERFALAVILDSVINTRHTVVFDVTGLGEALGDHITLCDR